MAASISASVGNGAVNKKADVKEVQKLLNKCRHLLIPSPALNEDGDSDDALTQLIKVFQRRVVLSSIPDGRVDPNGNTLAKLNENAVGVAPKVPLFPFSKPVTHDPKTGARFFGARRSNGRRKHAGVDLKQPPGTPIRAMEDGTVIQNARTFFQSTKAFAIDHGVFVARYCEISRVAPGVRKGAKVKKGDIIAFVGRLNSGNSMLHLELYSGTRPDTESLSNSTLPYKRRSDLLNPMDFINAATMSSVTLPPEGNARVSPRVITSLRVRDQPKLDGAKVLARLAAGSSFDVGNKVTGDPYETDTGTSDEWFEIDLGDTKGFVAAFYVDVIKAGPGTGGSSGAVDPVFAAGKVGHRVETVLHLRSSADASGTIVADLPAGTRLEIKKKVEGGAYNADGAQRKDWLEVTSEGQSGFVAGFYVDPVVRRGITASLVTSGLSLRERPDSESDRLALLSPGTSFSVIESLTGATYETASGERNDWYHVEHDTTPGFVAAFFVDLVDLSQPDDANAILFTYEPSGASDRTARQDGLPARGVRGVDASIAMATTDQARVFKHKATFNAAAGLFDLPPALLAAIASRETRGGAVLDRNGEGDRGNAFGIMQVDKRFHSPVETEGGPAGQEHIEQAAGILLDKLETVQRQIESLSDSKALQMAVSRYNGGRGLQPPSSDVGTTGGDYMNDVWARARFYAERW